LRYCYLCRTEFCAPRCLLIGRSLSVLSLAGSDQGMASRTQPVPNPAVASAACGCPPQQGQKLGPTLQDRQRRITPVRLMPQDHIARNGPRNRTRSGNQDGMVSLHRVFHDRIPVCSCETRLVATIVSHALADATVFLETSTVLVSTQHQTLGSQSERKFTCLLRLSLAFCGLA
jgi:hypothetical protein